MRVRFVCLDKARGRQPVHVVMLCLYPSTCVRQFTIKGSRADGNRLVGGVFENLAYVGGRHPPNVAFAWPFHQGLVVGWSVCRDPAVAVGRDCLGSPGAP